MKTRLSQVRVSFFFLSTNAKKRVAGHVEQIDGIGEQFIFKFRSLFEHYPRQMHNFFGVLKKSYQWYGKNEKEIVFVLQDDNYLEETFLPLLRSSWECAGERTIILTFDPVYIYKNPDYDTRDIMKKLIPEIEKNIPLKRMSTPASHILLCLQHAHTTIGTQTRILQHIMVFFSFDVVWQNSKIDIVWGEDDSEEDTRRMIFVNPNREKITVLNRNFTCLDNHSSSEKRKVCLIESRNFEYMKTLMISRGKSRLIKSIEEGRRSNKNSRNAMQSCCNLM